MNIVGKTILIILIAVIALLGGFFYFNFQKQSPISQIIPQINKTDKTSGKFTFSNPKKSLHYETNTPEHGSVLAGAPTNVVVNFNFDLVKPSEIRVYSSGIKNPSTGTVSPIDIALGETLIDENKLSMRRALDPKAPIDTYTVEYKACWPDGSCHDGSFQFAIDSTLQNKFKDETGKKEIKISMSQIKFQPENIKISKGTKVTWINNEAVGHYVNTDPHPGHNYYPPQNSKYLNKGDSYSLTFDNAGYYPYHCSVHASSMIGNIIVE